MPASVRPDMRFNSVVFPEPEGPMIAVRVPGLKYADTRLRTHLLLSPGVAFAQGMQERDLFGRSRQRSTKEMATGDSGALGSNCE